MKKQLKISPVVYENLAEIEAYIAADNPTAAAKLVDEILDEIDSLETSYNRGTDLQNRIQKKTRLKFILVRKYLVIYDIKPDSVDVMLVIHTAMELSGLRLV